MVARVVYVAQDGRPALLARVVYDEVAESEQALQDARRDRHVLNITQRDVTRRARHQTLIDHDLGVCQRVADHVAPDVVVGWNEQQRERERQGNVPGNSQKREQRQQDGQKNCAEGGGCVADLDEEHGGARREDCALDLAGFVIALEVAAASSSCSDSARSGKARHFGINGGRAAPGAETRARSDV